MSESAASLPRRDVVIFFAAALLLLTANLGGTTLAPLDDCFYARKAAEMAAHPGMTVLLQNRPDFQNPPGQLWLMGASMRVMGANDFAARLPAALMALGVIAGTAWIGARLLSPLSGMGAAALLFLSPLFLNNTRRAMLEIPTLFWTVLAMAALVSGRRRPAALLLLAPALAMAILTKSVLGLVPFAIAIAAASLLAEWRPLLRSRIFWSASIAGLALGASWGVHQWWTYGDQFTRMHFGREIANRSMASISIARRLLGYPAILLAQFQPVVVLAVPGAWRVGRTHGGGGGSRLLLVWALLPVAVAMTSAAQSSHYVFSTFPALALLGAAWLETRWPRALQFLVTRIAPACMIAGAALLWVRPELLTRDANRAYRDAAPALAARVAAGSEIAFLGGDYWRVANPLLWYDGLVLGRSAGTAEEALARARADGGLLMVERSRLASLPAEAAAGRRWIDSKDAVLLEVPPR